MLDDCGGDLRVGLCDDTFNLNGPLGHDPQLGIQYVRKDMA